MDSYVIISNGMKEGKSNQQILLELREAYPEFADTIFYDLFYRKRWYWI